MMCKKYYSAGLVLLIAVWIASCQEISPVNDGDGDRARNMTGGTVVPSVSPPVLSTTQSNGSKCSTISQLILVAVG